ncbi:snoRNA-binding rRNA-processing protein [Thelotrema lepadinum]|nr:snoRNA-binding rRNA-processing protein [Thelotrema lepadinum]
MKNYLDKSPNKRETIRHTPLWEDKTEPQYLEESSQYATANFVGSKASRRILQISQRLLEEESSEQDTTEEDGWREDQTAWDEESNSSHDDPDIWGGDDDNDIEPRDLEVFDQLMPQESSPFGVRSACVPVNLGELLLARHGTTRVSQNQPGHAPDVISFKALEVFK